MKPLLLFLFVLFMVSACQTVPLVQSYQPPGEQKQLLVEVRKIEGEPARYELKIDGSFVVEMPAIRHDSRVSSTYRGKTIELRGTFARGNQFIVEIFVDGAYAASFDFGA